MELVLTPLERLIRLRDGGAVTRFHTERFLTTKQDVAQHSFGVALLLMELYHPQSPSARLLLAALTHDLAEQETGDLPAPAKWAVYGEGLEELERSVRERLKVYVGLSSLEQSQLHAADFLEAMLTSLEQMMLGNQYIHIVMSRLRAYQDKKNIVGHWPPAWMLYCAICEAYDAAYNRQNPILQSLTNTDPWKHHQSVVSSRVPVSLPGQDPSAEQS